MEEVKEWDNDELLKWIQQKRPKLLQVGENLERFKAAQISGRVFLMLADDVKSFEKNCHLPFGPSVELVELARGFFFDESRHNSRVSVLELLPHVNRM